MNIGGPAYPASSIPVSTEVMGDYQFAMETSLTKIGDSGEVIFSLTESELSSYLSYELRVQSQPFISNPQVIQRDCELEVNGIASQGYLEATMRIVFTAWVDEQKNLKLELSSADFGPLAVPKGLTEIANSAIQEAFTGALGTAVTTIRLQSINIADRLITFNGQKKLQLDYTSNPRCIKTSRFP